MIDNARVDVKAFIDERTMGPMQWLLLALCFLVVAADGMDVAIMGFLAPSILQEWHASRANFGLVMSAAPIGLVLGDKTPGEIAISILAELLLLKSDGQLAHARLPVKTPDAVRMIK